MNSSGNSKVKTNENIQVYVRVRPINARERGIRSHEIIDVPSPKEILVRQPFDSKMSKKFYFDRTFGPDSKQSDVYNSVVSPLIEEVLSGYNCTVFAYGQTGTGKTHTMIGTECPELKSSWEDDSMVGIIPRALSHLFDELRLMEVEFSMRVSYLELYNEELCDLLSTDDTAKIRIYDDANKKGSVIIQGLEEITVHSKDDVYKLLEKGQERRKTATTLMNAQSSRSHTVFSIVVHIKENGMDGEEMLKIGKLNLVDLAGSENISKAGNEKGIRTRETVNINQSLLTLGRVITALVERTPHIPYRESKLTRLLQESLGGRTKTSIIATISPGHKDIDETLSTLEYAHRAKNIQNKPELNQKLTKKTVLKEYTEEIDKLKRDLIAAREKNGVYLAEETYYDMQYKLDSQNKELNEKMLLIKAMKDELAKKEKIFNEVSLHLVEKSEECKTIEQNFSHTQKQLDQTKKVLTTTKRRYKEKKHLLDNHVKTEHELTGQAKELIEVADVATTDTIQLHETIERRKDVDLKIQTSCEKFTETMKNSLSEIVCGLNNLEEKQKIHCNVMMEEMNLNGNQHRTFSTEIIENISTISNIPRVLMKEISSCVVRVSNLITEGDTEHHKSAIQKVMQEIIQKQDEFQSNFDSQVNKLTEIIDIQNEFIGNTVNNVLNKVTDNNRLISSFSTNAIEQLENFSDDMSKALETQFKNLNSTLGNYKNTSNKKTKVMKAMESLMEEWKILDQDEQSEIIKLDTVSQNIELSRNKIVDNLNTNKNLIDTFNKDCAIKSEELDKCINDIKNSATISLNNEKLLVSSLEELTVSNKNIILEKIDSIGDFVIQRNEDRKLILENFNKDITKIEQENSTSLDNVYILTKETINSECKRTQNFHTQNMALNNSLLGNVTEYSTTCHEQIDKCVDRIETFRKNELKTYTPTGQTPSRREFSYPRILAATSPHDRILRRFKLENEWSDLETTITEDSETSILDISNDRLLTNSTPIRQQNTELPENMLKSIPSEFNFKIPLIKITNISSKDSPLATTTLDHYDKENKENC